MNRPDSKGDPKIGKGKQTRKVVLQAYNDLNFVEGHEDEFICHLQKLTGWTREEIEKIVRQGH